MIRAIITALAAALALGLSACGAGETDADAAKEHSVTIEHAMGSTTIKGEPQRIVALDSSLADATLLLDKDLVGITTYRGYSTDLPDYLGDDREHAAEVVSVGDQTTPSLEKIAALKPDLIVSIKVRHEALYDQLSKIAPTIMPETSAHLFKENLLMLGKAVGQEQKAQEEIAAYEKTAKEVGDAINEKAGNPTISVTRFLDGPTRLYTKGTYSGVVLADAGLARPTSQETNDFALDISEEKIADADADKVFVTTYEDEEGIAVKTKAAFERNPLWKPIAPKVTEVSDTTWMTAVSLQGAYYILSDLAKTFGVDVEVPHVA
ncbi:ABC transporter substrate-binding protein [Nocardioides luteus]|uniref:Iron siderophore-binding protein n=1 Tax=Nocardioides luteus TaxID=1844 RepID=A0A1J4NB05_9ACTN|nr:iron-siderophore ABC transporter substrate-binding protein [Nocardioides luteus]OIJ27673.1 iron siderophore-binding protein [Nocardioides luteus]